MANKSDEEYHFSEEETSVSYTVEPDQPGKNKEIQRHRKSRNIILLLAILTAFWAIYKFIGIFLSPPKPIPHITKQTTKPAVPARVQPPRPYQQKTTVSSKSQPVPVQPSPPLVSPKPQVVQPLPSASSKPQAVQPLPPASSKPQVVQPLPSAGSKPQAVQPLPLESPKPQAVQPIPPAAQLALSAVQLQEISTQKARLNKMESEIINFQTTLSEINTKLSDLSTQVNNLASQPKPPPVVEIKEIKKPVRPIKRYHPRRSRYPTVIQNGPSMIEGIERGPYISSAYRLQAAIPGRAWLLRSDGANVTVSLGERLPGLGTVVGIDPNEGVVLMSSGATIKYRGH